ncbi:MAG: radical SAM protein [Nanoarchaeota archaeon]|nr:radical SAM protein [Nanoarchaeota archaeon]MBU1444873.1 radical SAM protein [Nanoarchaeota archaeon]MBU2420931.1 radical SAM protein [Nanoarchaeota archaeon]MBU2475150.1 radical SAM protein [Nanoarchaeota archaeon]
MIEKILQSMAFRKFGFPKVPPLNLTIGLTNTCNSRCLTCNIWKKSSENDLSLNELDKIFQNIGPTLEWLILSGGEPFLRKDIVEICASAYKYCKPSIIVIPTNGILFNIIPKKVEEILKKCPKSRVTINLSLDGLNQKHDEIRNIKGNWELAIKTFNSLKKLKKYKNLELGIHTVISKLNYKEIPELYAYVKNILKPDEYITEIAEKRVELETLDLEHSPDYKEYSYAINFLSNELKKQKLSIKQLFRLKYYNLVKVWLKKHTQILPCYGGFASAQIAQNGDVWPCCVRADVLGNLREENYNFKKIWFNKKAKEVRKSIKNKECSCPLASASYINLMCDQKTIINICFNFLGEKLKCMH